jgi:oleandomycin transport system ATP-binding protein
VRPTELADMDRAAAIVESVVGTTPSRHTDDVGLLSVPVDDEDAFTAVVMRLKQEQIRVTELALRLASLDEVFLALTGHDAQERGDLDARERGNLEEES